MIISTKKAKPIPFTALETCKEMGLPVGLGGPKQIL